MAEKLNPNVLYVGEPRESVSSLDSDRLTQPDAGEESSDSDGEQEISHKLIRKVSTSGQIRAKMAEKRNPNVLYVGEPRESVSSLDSDRLTQPDAGEESSDSDGEQEISHKLIRKVSTSGQIRAKVTAMQLHGNGLVNNILLALLRDIHPHNLLYLLGAE
ncbi:UNVERIFIED_CONTAM: hypothetical protein FKN15_050650 [Acipenser sinensis]